MSQHPPHSRIRWTAALTLAASLALGACGGADEDGTATPAGDDVDRALEAAAPTGTVEVPTADGATTIAEYAAGGSSYQPADENELVTILALIGTDADGYLTDDAVVVRTTTADATLLCGTIEQLDIAAYQVIPVGPDGAGIDCE